MNTGIIKNEEFERKGKVGETVWALIIIQMFKFN